MLKKAVVSLSLVALAIAGASVLDAQAQRLGDVHNNFKPQDNSQRDPSQPRTRAVAPRMAPGRNPTNIPVGIIYDDGIATALPGAGLLSYSVGNQFNTASGMTVKSFSVTMLSWYMFAGSGSDSVFISLYGPVSGTVAPFIEDISVPLNNGSGAFNTATIGPYAGAGSFQAGVWYVAGDTVGLGSGTVAGQGHHGMAIDDIVGTDWQTLPGLNALVGAATANIIPVELTAFEISDE